MNDNTVYVLSEELNSIIDKDVEIMDSWLTALGDEELHAFHSICNKDSDERSGKEDYEITRYSLVLYCRELALEELAITSELISNITGIFCINIIIPHIKCNKNAFTWLRRIYKETPNPLSYYRHIKSGIPMVSVINNTYLKCIGILETRQNLNIWLGF